METAALRPPTRYDGTRFSDYVPQNESQADALHQARQFVRLVRIQYARPALWGLWPRARTGLGAGVYFVGPVGTGKTHLLAAIYHALTAPAAPGVAPVACAFTHSSDLFRATETPEAYAARVAAEARVLCIDEVELDDPAGEVRLIGVLKALREHRVTIAASSNAEPDAFVSAAMAQDRLARFIAEEFEREYHVVPVRGSDYRQGQARAGRAWVGPPEAARAAMRAAYDAAPEPRRWLSFDELLARTASTERRALAWELAEARHLFIDGIAIRTTDDALRLLRVADDLYQMPEPPTLYFTSEQAPAEWFRADGARGVERAIAEKFARTTSRLTALAAVERVSG